MAENKEPRDTPPTAADETAPEREESTDTGATPEEAHREGEFADLVKRLDIMTAKIDAVQAAITTALVDRPGPDTPGDSPAVDLADLDSWDW